MNIEDFNLNENYNYLLQFIQTKGLELNKIIVLDIGAGNGTTVFLSLGSQYHAIDTNKDSIEALNIRLKKINENFSTFNNNFLDFEFEFNKYDLIIMNNFLTIIEFKTISQNLEKARSLLNENGYLSILVNSSACSEISLPKEIIKNPLHDRIVEEIAMNKFKRTMINNVNDVFHHNYYDKCELEEILINAKFKIIECNEINITNYINNECYSTLNFIVKNS